MSWVLSLEHFFSADNYLLTFIQGCLNGVDYHLYEKREYSMYNYYK